MKTKKIIVTLLALGLVGAGRLLACDIHFEPAKPVLAAGASARVSVFVKFEHRRCDIPIEDTRLEAKNIEIVERGAWTELKSGLYRLDLEIRLGADRGELRAIRECEKKGVSEGVLQAVSR
ncbi:MAG: hypothetical protein JW742_01230 [Candidatus Aminicenantes bacterium]|nr:hypothetical protein [Candidatus Aminicenantes bacterium]